MNWFFSVPNTVQLGAFTYGGPEISKFEKKKKRAKKGQIKVYQDAANTADIGKSSLLRATSLGRVAGANTATKGASQHNYCIRFALATLP